MMIMVGLVPGELSEAVLWEGDSGLAEVVEATCTVSGLAQRKITIHAPPIEQRPCHILHRIGNLPAHGQFVVGLLVRTGVAAGAARQAFGKHHHVVVPELRQPVCRTECTRPAADDNGRAGMEFYRSSMDLHRIVFQLILLPVAPDMPG